MGSRTPIAKSTARSLWNMSLLWKVLTIIVILHVCRINHINAKQVQSDLSFDDTLDIDQLEETGATKLRSARDLDDNALLADELQPVETEADDPEGSWLMQGVKRVRRELNRLFGNEAAAAKHYRKRGHRNDRQQHNQSHNRQSQHTRRLQQQQQRKKRGPNHNAEARTKRLHHQSQHHQRPLHQQTNRHEKHLRKLAKPVKHYKRASYNDDEVEGSGLSEENGEDIDGDNGQVELYQTLFTVNEPWQESYREGKYGTEFMKLHRELETAFRDYFYTLYGHDDVDYDIRANLISVQPTSDFYKIHVIVQLELPEKMKDFGSHMRQDINNSKRFGELSADIDGYHYFKRVRDISDGEEGITANGYPEPHGNGHDREADHGEGEGEGDGYGDVGDIQPMGGEGEGVEHGAEHMPPHGYESECDVNPYGKFICHDGQEIYCYERCDRKYDCEDLSDEDPEMCEALAGGRVPGGAEGEVEYEGPEAGMEEHEREEHEREEHERREHEREEQERAEHERREQERAEHERREQERAEHERREQERAEHERWDQEREEEGRAEYERREQERAEQERWDQEREEQGRAEYERREQERAEHERREQERAEHERREQERAEHERREQERAEHERREQERAEHERREHERAEHERREHEREREEHEGEGAGREEPEGFEHVEYDCLANPEGEFMCHNGQLIPCYLRCDSLPDCPDGSDESPDECARQETDRPAPEEPTTDAGVHEEEGGRYGNGYDTTHAYDGGPAGTHDFDASGDDTFMPHTETSPVYTGCRGDAYYTCYESGDQICEEQLCDGIEQCPDGEDELDCPETEPPEEGGAPEYGRPGEEGEEYEKVCSEYEFKCDDRCVPKSYQCNGVVECSDGTDEENCPEKECEPHEFKCRSGHCIDGRRRCDHVPDCPDGDDEDASCLTTVLTPEDCTSEQFFCDDDCHPISIRCNGYADCVDRSDEQNCPPAIPYPTRRPLYPCPQHTCPDGKCYSESERCDGVPNCDDGSDEANCCAADQYRCRNGDCVPGYAHCNGYRECRDGSDEEDCADIVTPGRACLPSQFRCDNGQCISAMAKCDGYTDCADSSDEKYCTHVATTPAPQLNLKTYPDNQIIKESREVIFRCRDEGLLRAKVRWTRPGGRPLPPGFSDKNGRLEIPNIRVEDSGTYICEAVGYPRHIPGQQVSVQLTVEKYTVRDERLPSACLPTQATCMNGECIDKSQICDGVPHCSDGSDEHSCSHGRKCHPNQFMCRNSKCIDRVWRCDGEDDCGDHSDEESCDPEPSGAPCRYDEFQCRSGHCIPKSFQCDDTNDCRDGSDEIGCMVPDKIRDPPPTAHLRQGDALNLTCVGTGIPVPVIVWRLNWGHVPDKCTTTSYAGTGTIYCPNMEEADSGAYSCEIINTKGSKFATDTLVTVESPTPLGVCPAGFFNMLARRRDECINCFCFGITKNCKSANLYNYVIQPPVTSHRVVNVELSPYSDIVISEAPSTGVVTLRHGVQFRASDVPYDSRVAPYLALPSDYMGNQLKSYGGFIKYDMSFVGSGRPNQSPDVIITGNGYTLTHRSRSQAQSNGVNKMEVQFTPGNWRKPDGRSATREEIMMVLANVENILIRLSYVDTTEREVEITNILMNSAGVHDQGLGQASLVEQCSCPVGYIGDSCETCAPGYVRQPGGPWLGRCVPFVPEPCAPGTYGDPRRGIPCRECPCPQTGANNFASGCQLGPDNEVTCNCHEGYTGRRCELCAPGYQGNPLVPGGHCYPVPESTCNPEGTYYPHPNGTCECKQLVVGPRCDTCAPDSFHLNAFTYTGCIECFCSGLPVQCSSSSWYRDQISSNFGRSRAPHGFTLITDYQTPEPSSVDFELHEGALQFSHQPNSEPLYWSLPAQFLGDKITAYGGKLNYTLSYNPLPGGLMSRNSAPDVVIKSGEDLTMIHYRKTGVAPSQPTTYSVPIIESAWQRSDGQVVNRQHLLMALSKIDAIYIKATYTTSTRDGTLAHVSLDIATPTNIGTARAVEVEECRCPEGYIGLSCERCAPGYKRNPEAGLYLGVCEPCECNGHSTQCDAESGVCLNCADNTAGDFCDRCAPGYEGDATGGTPYDCSPSSGGGPINPYPPASPPTSGNQTHCPHCHYAGTASCEGGYCYCKPNVVGTRCDQCRPGTYGLSEHNPEGCEECFCSHKTSTCNSAPLYRQLIPVDFFSSPPLFTDDEGLIADTDNLHHDVESNEYIYSYTSYTPKYWSLRGSVLGNQLYSYGGSLSYNLQVESYGHYEPGNDVILIGNGMKLLWSRPADEQDSSDYSIRLHEDENWHTLQRGQMQRATRLDFMNVLSNLEHILIRATPKIPTTRTAIRDVILESAIETPSPGSVRAVDIELCACPPGYAGTSCESCAAMFYRDNYGNCATCPCQEDTSTSCALDESGYVKCQCKPGYGGDRCQNPESNPMETVPSRPPPPPPDYDYRTQISVSIAPPEITIIPVGGSITLTCTGRLAWNGSPVIVSWYKLNGQLPRGYELDDGVLRLYDLQIHDSGVYICQAISNQTQRVFEDKVSITITEDSRRSPARIENLPPYVTFEEYQPNAIDCEVSGTPPPSVIWTRVDGQMSREAHTDGSRLIFESPRRSDEGSYRCQANNGIGSDEKYTQIYVRPTAPQPTPPPRELVYIEPPSFSGEAGEYVRLVCQPTTSITLNYEWTKDGYPLYRQHNLVISGNMLEIRESTPRDSGVYTCIGIDLRSRRNYTTDAQVIIEESRPAYPPHGGAQGPPGTVPPSVKRLPDENRVVQGQDFSITCEASGTPYPTIRWTKVHEALADNVHQTGNVLRIMNIRPENRGVYLCIAENSAGSDQSSTVIDVEPREHPTVDIDPKEPQTHQAGSQGMLYCTANGIPEPTVHWRRVDGKPLSPRHQEQAPGYVIINDITIEDAGDYECIAENDIGKATAQTTLHVIESPVITLEPSEEYVRVTEGDEVKITCSASGFPNPNVQWVEESADTRRMRPVAESLNQAFLEIYRVSRTDSKTYKCVATNEAGIDERYVTLDVMPRRGDAPDDSDVDRHPAYYQPSHGFVGQTPPENIYKSKTGEDVTLTCDLTSTGHAPPLEARWERMDGRPMPDNSYNDRNSLIITGVNEQNAGKYRCNGLDNRGTVITFHIAELVLVPIPHITLHPKMPMYVTANENVDIYCEVEGEQPIHVSWHADNNRPLPPSVRIEGQYLRFISITPADAGRYYCSASNRYGNTTEMAEVVVNRGYTYEPQPQARRYDLTEGETVRITCDVQPTHGPVRGEIRYEWRREDNRPLPSNAHVRNHILYLDSVRKQDEGRYVCESYSTSGAVSPPSYADLFIKPGARPLPPYAPQYVPPPTTTPRPRDLSLKLDQQRSNLRVGESTEVECYSSDSSYTDVIWERADGEPLPPHIQQIGNRLIISHVTAADAGNYVCKCKTDEGDLYTTSYELEIEESPHQWKRPKIVHANVGAMVRLLCDADQSAGTPSYRWSRQYGQMQLGTDILRDHLILHDVQANDAGTYICTASPPYGEPVDYPTILVVDGAIPHFHQEPLSYMAFPTLRDSSIKLNFDITFRPEEDNGLLLFNGQKRGSGDYISLSLKDRYPEFRFNFDGKPMVVRSEQPITLNEWHTVRVNRFRRDGYMQVDDQYPVAFPTLPQIAPLDLIEDLYIGGVPNWDLLPADAIDRQVGFVGCISRLTLQGAIVELMKEAKFKEGISACKPCEVRPCANGGICLESQTEMGYTCICQQGWTGHNCGVEGTQCTPGICGVGRCENTETGMVCLCPLNKTGDRCQYIEHLNDQSLGFKTNSYAAYGTPRASKLNIKFQVRPNSLEDAVLLYAAESKLPSGDYIAVVLRNKHVELIINTSARLKPLVVRSLHPLPLNKWTEIEVSRRFGEGILKVGQEPEQKAKATGLARTLYIKTPLYIGGVDHENVKLNRDVNITNGFDGCISNLYEAQRPLNLIADIQDAANIRNCGEINEIEQNETFVNEAVEHAPTRLQDACASDPCENGGSCSLHNNEAVCSCGLGFAGKHCEEHITIKFDANFHGNGYLELDRNQFDEAIEQKYSFAAMVFSTTDPNGLLLWWGQPKGEEYKGQDFMALAIVDGIVEFAFRLNGEENVIRNPDKRVDDGRRHIVLIKRTDNTAILELDYVLYADETRPTGKDTMSLPGHVFIGGTPDIAKFTGGRYTKNFNGCVRVVEGESSGTIQLGNVAISGINVDTCPIADEFLDGTEPPVV